MGDFADMRMSVYQHLCALDVGGDNSEFIFYNALFGTSDILSRVKYDVIILHNTFLGMRWHPKLLPLVMWRTKWIKDAECLKIAIPQDEYDHSELLDQWLFEWGVDVVISNFDVEQHKVLYSLMLDKASFYEAFTGYIDQKAAKLLSENILPINEREIDIVYRAKKLPYWFGSHGQIKYKIAKVVHEQANRRNLRTDISTLDDDLVVGDRWLDFLASGKAVIGCESGSSVLDKRGETRRQILEFQRKGLIQSFEDVDVLMSKGWDDHHFTAISPRHFEAIITKTCQILVEGNYDGVLEPNKHYIPLKRDFSNLDEVLDKISDHEYLQLIADQAYNDIYINGVYTYKHFSAMIEEIIQDVPTSPQTALQKKLWVFAQLSAQRAFQVGRFAGRIKRLCAS